MHQLDRNVSKAALALWVEWEVLSDWYHSVGVAAQDCLAIWRLVCHPRPLQCTL